MMRSYFESPYILDTKGTDYEVGLRHGKEFAAYRDHALPAFFDHLWKKGFEASLPKSAARLVRGLVEQTLARRLAWNVPLFARERLQGLSAGMGVPMRELTQTLVLPDLMCLFQNYAYRFQPSLMMEVPGGGMRFGCSSFFFRGNDGNAYFGRNLDFPGVGYWDKYPVLQRIQKPGCLTYLACTAVGFPVAGVTGINEKAIAIALHQHYGKESSWGGVLPYVYAEEALAHCSSLAEVKAYLEKAKLASSWAFVCIDGNSKEGFVYETQGKQRGVRWFTSKDKFLSHTNFFQCAQTQAGEFTASSRMHWDNVARKERMDSFLENLGDEDPTEALIRLLGDSWDPYWEEERPFNRTVSQILNIQSVLFDFDRKLVWVACGETSVQNQQYVAVSWGDIFAQKVIPEGVLQKCGGFRFRDAALFNSKKALVAGAQAAMEYRESDAAASFEKALGHHFFPETALIAAMYRMRAGNYPGAEELLGTSADFLEGKRKDRGKKEVAPEYLQTLLYLARARELQGKKNQADAVLGTLKKLSEVQDPRIHFLASSRKRFNAKTFRKMVVPFSSYAPLF